MVAVKALYSASAELLEIVGCFLVHQEMRESPIKIQTPVIDLRIMRHDAQAESENPPNCKLDNGE